MKGWVGLVGWPVEDGLPTLVVTHQLQVERRTRKVRQSETDVLPLCYATNYHCQYCDIILGCRWEDIWQQNCGNNRKLAVTNYTLLSWILTTNLDSNPGSRFYSTCTHTHTHTHTFNGPLSGTTQVSWYQKGKTNLDFLKQETVSGSGISWAVWK